MLKFAAISQNLVSTVVARSSFAGSIWCHNYLQPQTQNPITSLSRCSLVLLHLSIKMPSNVPSIIPSTSPSSSPSSIPFSTPSMIPLNAPSILPSTMPSSTFTSWVQSIWSAECVVATWNNLQSSKLLVQVVVQAQAQFRDYPSCQRNIISSALYSCCTCLIFPSCYTRWLRRFHAHELLVESGPP